MLTGRMTKSGATSSMTLISWRSLSRERALSWETILRLNELLTIIVRRGPVTACQGGALSRCQYLEQVTVLIGPQWYGFLELGWPGVFLDGRQAKHLRVGGDQNPVAGGRL